METPETYESLDVRPDAPKGCPWKNTIVPGPMAGQITFKTVPCQKRHCELWCSETNRCAFRALPANLLEIAVELTSLRNLLEKAEIF